METREMDWHELVELTAKGQMAMTTLQAIRAILQNIYNDTEAINDIRAILKKEEKAHAS